MVMKLLSLLWNSHTSALPKAVLLVHIASIPSPELAASALLRPATPVSTAGARFTKSILALIPESSHSKMQYEYLSPHGIEMFEDAVSRLNGGDKEGVNGGWS
jgi:hypothetical protein